MAATSLGTVAWATGADTYHEPVEPIIAAISETGEERQFDSTEDIRQFLRDGGRIYRGLSVSCETGKRTYMVPVPNDEILEDLMILEGGDIQPFSGVECINVGDLTGNGRISIMDVALLRTYVMGMGHTLPDSVLTRIDEGAGNINGASEISMVDVVLLRTYVMGMGYILSSPVIERLLWHSRYTRIICSGLSLEDSIVVMLFGDGFEFEARGTWPNPNPAQGTVLWYAYSVMNSMLSVHPFSDFADLFTVYVIHTHGTHPIREGFSYLGTLTENRTLINSDSLQHRRMRELADAIVPRRYQTMKHVIANLSPGAAAGGFAFMGWMLNPQHSAAVEVNVAVTGIYRSSNTPWPNETVWHATFIHEFGHSFGVISDENSRGPFRERIANVTNRANIPDPVSENIKWSHWIGHRGVILYRYALGNFVVPTAFSSNQSCFMTYTPAAGRVFCGVCTSELIRRLAFVSREPFLGRSPLTDTPYTVIPYIPHGIVDLAEIIPETPEPTRILDSAFHGNRYLKGIDIPVSVEVIGDFAFIGTNLTKIISRSETPPELRGDPFIGLREERTREDITVQIPPGTTAAYLAAGWTGFNLVEGITGFDFD